MCSVMPLRLGVFLVACFTVVWSLCIFAFPGLRETFICFTGGFCMKSRLALNIICAAGIVFGLCGAVGAWNCKRTLVLTFNVWQVFRILVFAYVYYVDVPLLDTCEMWVNDVDGMIAKHGWNDLMYKIAMAAVCGTERNRFWICSGFSFLLLLYVTWKTHTYIEEVGAVPRHLLRIPKDLTSGAWYAHPTGEKHFQTGAYTSPDAEPAPVGFSNAPSYGAANPGFAV